MSEPLPEDFLDQVEAELAELTEGPWELDERFMPWSPTTRTLVPYNDADQRFMANARQYVPLLLQEIRRLRAST